ncbi:DUF443 family protein [Virgibacillus sp. 179-BFC.A HS]|uniref:DUF443 family protein n=1 Tax=Tigheibacillus jepli TaxID=3035914 RepID=A0ABU5CEU8_9BACI|nr:DUF443 family protein [Virgibacillus sp. 179-BFC.A HS]MDY0404078.1 DUF443 family protein [Virgibacillus sp. 179-BFC.A HS]
MNGEVQLVYRKMRYKFLTINDENYIIDQDRRPWLVFFPFAFWMIPHTAFKIDDKDKLEQIKLSKNETKTSYFSALGVGVSLLLANLLKPLMAYLNIQTSVLMNVIILFLFLLLVTFFRFFLSNMNKNSLYNTVKLDHVNTTKLWIRPKSIKYVLAYLFAYFSFSIFSDVNFNFY